MNIDEPTPHKRSGSCVCGAVRYRAQLERLHVDACHCSICRNWTGGPLISIKSEASPEFEGEENIVRYASSDWAERGFCGRCGAHLFYHYLPFGNYFVAAGSLDDQSGLTMSAQIFIDEKPDYYEFAGEMETMTGAEVMKAFGVGEDN